MYSASRDKYIACHDKVGKQFLAQGIGTTNLDGNDDEDDSPWSRWRFDTIQMVRNGDPSRVVIDVPYESDKKQDKDERDPDDSFWTRKSFLDEKNDTDDDDINEDEAESDQPVSDTNIPLFPVLPVFDLTRHVRLRVHVDNLTEYVYDPKLGEKLVLPKDSRDLVELLLSHKGEFKDIVSKKGGGAVIACAGPPGVGKTLTAEVYAEVAQRPLYSVQASQLGTNEEKLETELLKVFQRSQRWNAILLIDEADVYVAARGHDLQQNAIVGVFLRVLEYYQGVLFMTTNRADLVDDAILSRCVARIDYGPPTPADQARIWRILSETSGVNLAPTAVTEIVTRYPRLSGRDVKQLLKLSHMIAKSRGESEITAATIEFAKKFKPTIGDGKADKNEPEAEGAAGRGKAKA